MSKGDCWLQDIIIFCLGVGLALGFAIGSVVCIMYYTSKKTSPTKHPNIWESLWLLASFVFSCFFIDNVFDILTHALESQKKSIKEFKEYTVALKWLKNLSYFIFIPITAVFAFLMEAKASNRYIFKGFMWGILNALFVVITASFAIYKVAIEYDNSNLMNYGSLFLSGGAFVVTIFIASLQLKDTVEKETIENND